MSRELNWAAKLLGFGVYGKSLMNEKARLALNFVAYLILVQFLVDWTFWGMAFNNGFADGFVGRFLSILIGFAFAFAILMLERFVVIARVGVSGWVAGLRTVLVFVAAVVTAIPLAMGVFASEIERRIADREKKVVDAIRERGLTEEKAKYDGDGTGAKLGLLTEAQREYDGTPTKPGLIEIERRKFEGEDIDGDGVIEPGLIGKAEKAVVDDEANALAKAQAAYDRVKNDRAAKRAQMLKPHTDAVLGFTDRFNKLQDEGTSEAAGSGKSGRYGLGSGFKAAKAAERDTKAALDQATATRDLYARDNIVPFDLETETMLAPLKDPITAEPAKAREAAAAALKEARNKRDLGLKGLREKRDLRVSDLRKERDVKVEEVQKMSNQALADKYGGTWEESRGFMARYAVLNQITAEDPANSRLNLGCHIAMMFFGLTVLMTSMLMKKDDTSNYLNEGLQHAANADDPGLIEVGVARGYSRDPEVRSAMAMSKEIRDLREALHPVREVSVRTFQAWMDAVGRLCNPPDGLCLPLTQLRQAMRVKWNELVVPAIRAVGVAEVALEAKGGSIPAWPIARLGLDPRYEVDQDGTQNAREPLTEPWATVHSDEDLAHLGWTDPTELRRQITGQTNDLATIRRKIVEVVRKFHSAIERSLGQNPMIEYSLLQRRHAQQFAATYNDELFPLLNDMQDKLEWLATKGQGTTAWNPAIRGPVAAIWDLSQVPSPKFLADFFGWQGVVQTDASFVPPPLRQATRALEVPEAPATVPNQPAVELCGSCNQATPVDSELCVSCGIRRNVPASTIATP